jgi:hypothetical protein
MKATTTSEFLKEKVNNFQNTLVRDHKADKTTLDKLIQTHLSDSVDLTTYAQKLRGKDKQEVALQFASYARCHDEETAAACIRKYLECFQSVTDGFTY